MTDTPKKDPEPGPGYVLRMVDHDDLAARGQYAAEMKCSEKGYFHVGPLGGRCHCGAVVLYA